MGHNDSPKISKENIEYLNEYLRKYLASISAVVIFLISAASFFGYNLIRDSLINSSYTSQIKDDILIQLQGEMDNLKTNIKKSEEINKKYTILLHDFNKKSEELKKLHNLVEKLSVNYDVLKDVVPSKVIDDINTEPSYKIMKAFGITPFNFLQVLLNESDLNLHSLNKGQYDSSIRFIQQKYELSIDGQVGPCTALVLSSLSNKLNHLKNNDSLFHKNPDLIWMFSACSRDDKKAISRLIDNNDDLHIKETMDHLGIEIILVSNLISTDDVDAKAYDAIRKLKLLTN